MQEITASLLSYTDDLFTPGIPFFREPRFRPLKCSSHFTMYDLDKKSPAWSLARLDGGNLVKLVERKDNFSTGHYTMNVEDCTSESHYKRWNELNPDRPYDKGHQIGSQFRRGNELEQSDIDMLASCCPETPALNRQFKAPLESRIYDAAKESTECFYCCGPGFKHTDVEQVNKLPNGQWIPDFVWISTLFRKGKTIKAFAWTMQNVHHDQHVDLKQVSLKQLEEQTGLALWTNVRINDFVTTRHKITEFKG